jgi:hypothetical protein
MGHANDLVNQRLPKAACPSLELRLRLWTKESIMRQTAAAYCNLHSFLMKRMIVIHMKGRLSYNLHGDCGRIRAATYKNEALRRGRREREGSAGVAHTNFGC